MDRKRLLNFHLNCLWFWITDSPKQIIFSVIVGILVGLFVFVFVVEI